MRRAVRDRFNIEVETVTIQRTPNVKFGDLATPLPFELAKQLRRPPREIAAELASALGQPEGVNQITPAGGGYLNFSLDRGAFFGGAVRQSRTEAPDTAADAPKVIVEHTNINPNKAAHIGHLRNAVLGDTFVRLLRFNGERVEVQNYIDNTGVQVADVLVGFEHLEKKTFAEVEKLIRQTQPPFDYVCWDLYARVTRFYQEDKQRLDLRAETLKAIEEGSGETAQLAEIISTAIVHRHLDTAWRLGVAYDVLPRESEILELKFWDAAFALLKDRGAIEYSESGKTKGCWVMRTDGAAGEDASLDDAKIIVRSNGTVTYVGKDIAYQLWKFGLLDREFGYHKFHTYPDGHSAWMTAAGGESDAPAFGHGAHVYNVIDARQSYLQTVVAAGVRALGYEQEADRSIHFSYEMVGLSPRCARELGLVLSAEDEKKTFVEVSGRKGLGVKADDLLDRLEEAALAEVRNRHPDLSEAERRGLAHKIAVAALRFFMLRYTRNSVIAFDFKDALSFEGETGPYLQYSVVRARNIFRKLKDAEPDYPVEELPKRVTSEVAGRFLAAEEGDGLWEVVLTASELRWLAESALSEQEPATLAKWSFALAQRFNLFYHRHHILSEADPDRKALLLLLADTVQRQLTQALDILGIEIPERM